MGVEAEERPKPRGRSWRAFEQSNRELDWYFGAAAARLGLRGQNYEGGQQGVFDENASWRLHEKMEVAGHDVRRARAVEAVLAKVCVAHRWALLLAYDPGRASYALRVAFSLDGWTGTLASLAVTLPSAAAAYAAFRKRPADHDEDDGPSAAALHRWLEEEAASLRARKTLGPVREEAIAEFTAALAAYDAVRRQECARL